MRLLILSDLHVEFGNFTPVIGLSFDVVILAGDIHTKGRAAQWAAQAYPNTPVILVFGNHDFYGSNLRSALEQAKRDAQGTQVHVLHNSSVVLDGVRFLGATLWTDYRLTGNQPLAMLDAHARGPDGCYVMADFSAIRNHLYQKLRPLDLLKEHTQARAYLSEQLEDPFSGPTVVVTHHAPSGASIAPRYKEKMSHDSASYASSLEHLMTESLPLWVHGHTHDSVDVTIAGTRILCNPRGYVGEKLNPEFNPALIVEV